MSIDVILKFKGKTYRSLKDLFTEKVKLLQKKTFDELEPNLQKWILDDYIAKGKSPVSYKRDYVPYSQSYKDQIKKKWSRLYGKRVTPVNLKLTGALHESFYVKRKHDKKLEIGFSDEKAVWHNEGEGNLPRRPLLPSQKGETLKSDILKKIKKTLVKSANKTFKGR